MTESSMEYEGEWKEIFIILPIVVLFSLAVCGVVWVCIEVLK